MHCARLDDARCRIRQSASATTVSFSQCNNRAAGPGGAPLSVTCTVNIVNNITPFGNSSTVTFTRNCTLNPCTGDTVNSSDVVNAVHQCNGSDNVGGSTTICNVNIVNNISVIAPVAPTALTVSQCIGSGAGGGTDMTGCVPSSQGSPAVTQCNGSGNGGGGRDDVQRFRHHEFSVSGHGRPVQWLRKRRRRFRDLHGQHHQQRHGNARHDDSSRGGDGGRRSGGHSGSGIGDRSGRGTDGDPGRRRYSDSGRRRYSDSGRSSNRDHSGRACDGHQAAAATNVVTPTTPALRLPQSGDAGLLRHTRSGLPAAGIAFACRCSCSRAIALTRLRAKRRPGLKDSKLYAAQGLTAM